MVAQRYDLRLETRKTGPGSLPASLTDSELGKQWSRDYPIDVPLRLRSPMLTFFCPRGFDRAVMPEH